MTVAKCTDAPLLCKQNRCAVAASTCGQVHDSIWFTTGATLSTINDEMVEMSNGCICCTLREDMLKEIVR